MKLSVLPVSLFGEITGGKISIPQWARMARDAGTDGFDISTLFWKNHVPVYIDSIEKELQKTVPDIEPVMVCTYPDFTNPDPLERERQVDYLCRDIALASRFGFRYVRITAGMAYPGLEFTRTCRQVAECFVRIGECGRKYGIVPVFENHAKPGAWQLVDFSFDPEAFLTICRLIRDTDVFVNFDAGNAYVCGADPVKMFREVSKQVRTIHMSDLKKGPEMRAAAIGAGVVDYDAFFREVGMCDTIEYVCIEEASGRGIEGINEAVRFARRYVISEEV